MVSRKITSLSEDGLVDKIDISDIRLTDSGRQLAGAALILARRKEK